MNKEKNSSEKEGASLVEKNESSSINLVKLLWLFGGLLTLSTIAVIFLVSENRRLARKMEDRREGMKVESY